MKRGLITFLFLCICSMSVKAQEANIDSLYRELRHPKHDTDFIKTSTAYGEVIFSNYPDSSAVIWKRAYRFGLKKQAGLKRNDPLFRVYILQVADLIENIGTYYNNQGLRDSAMAYYLQSYALFEKTNDKAGMASSSENLSVAYFNYGEIERAREYALRGMKLYEEVKQKNGVASCNYQVARSYRYQEDILTSLDFYFKSRDGYEATQNKDGLVRVYNDLGEIYHFQRDYEKAKLYFDRCLKILEQTGDQYQLGDIWQNLGHIYYAKQDYTTAKDYFEKSLETWKKLNARQSLGSALANVGNCYKYLEDFEKALSYFTEGLSLLKEVEDVRGLAAANYNIGDVYLRRGKYNEALPYLLKGMELAKSRTVLSVQRNAAQALRMVYEKMNKPDLALQMAEFNLKMRDSITGLETKKATLKKQLQYDYERKTTADSVRVQEQKKANNIKIALQNTEIKKEQTQRNALYTGLALLAVFVVFMYNRFKIAQKQKQLIEGQKKEVQHQKELAEEKQREILGSITYARRIQRSLLASESYIEKTIGRLSKEGAVKQ